jgi:hypothetical protein
MARGNRPAPAKGPAGTSHHPAAGEQTVEIVAQDHSAALASCIAAELPDGLPRQVFLRSVDELGDRLRDMDLEALRIMAWALHRADEAQRDVEACGMFEYHEIYGKRPNPALKIARDEANLYLKIADQYALTFVSRLRAGILQLAGQSMFEQLHESMAAAIVSRIVATDPVERRAIEAAVTGVTVHVCADCEREFASGRGLAVHRSRAHPPKPKKRKRK